MYTPGHARRAVACASHLHMYTPGRFLSPAICTPEYTLRRMCR
jgi:hypothetical protein